MNKYMFRERERREREERELWEGERMMIIFCYSRGERGRGKER